jgi:type IV secretion system protein VirB2
MITTNALRTMRLKLSISDAVAPVAQGMTLAARYRPVITMASVIASLVASFPGIAMADTVGDDPATMVNNICNFILGDFGQALAVLGIVAIGLAWMFGRASLGLIAGVIGGVVIMFGASTLGKDITQGN